ncbi:cytochrome b5-like heme/steroid binding domain-containing protein [Hydrogenophaga sp. 5NK40-0174]|uniref:cytochrome b5-like heme/steroid binding domain-containing protein n=1 Tax=Hydrogenophaga sp. 5NK40-0174 TaxID=3127649 RepID=UPI00333ECFFD
MTISTVAFWGFVLAVQLGGFQSHAQSAPAKAKLELTLKEVARHDNVKDCWMVINNEVYNFTGYIPKHPSPPSVMLRHCGKEATDAFATKEVGREHSAYAQKLLNDYHLGPLANTTSNELKEPSVLIKNK